MSEQEAGRQLWVALHRRLRTQDAVYWWPTRWERLPEWMQQELEEVATHWADDDAHQLLDGDAPPGDRLTIALLSEEQRLEDVVELLVDAAPRGCRGGAGGPHGPGLCGRGHHRSGQAGRAPERPTEGR